MLSSQGKNELHLKYAYHHSCLVSDSTISYHFITPHMSVHHSTRMHSPLKNVLGKIGCRYQAHCTTYKTHAMATHHGDVGCPLDRGNDLHTEDLEPADILNEHTNIPDATVALGGPEAEGRPKDPVYNNCYELTALMREINDLHQ